MSRSRGREDERSYSVGEGRQDIIHPFVVGDGGKIKVGIIQLSEQRGQKRPGHWSIFAL